MHETIEIKKSRSTSLNFKSEDHSGRKEISKLKCNRLQNNAIGSKRHRLHVRMFYGDSQVGGKIMSGVYEKGWRGRGH